MTYSSSAPIVKRLLFPCTSAIAAAHALDSCWYETIGSQLYLKMYVGRNKYTQIAEDRELNYVRSLLKPIAPLSLAVTGFEVASEHVEQEYEDTLQHIALNCLNAAMTVHTPIAVLDFVKPDYRDRVLDANGEYYTIRTGRITSIQGKGASVGLGSKIYGEGVTVRFEEVNKRRWVG